MRFAFGRDARVNTLIGTGHFLSHYYGLCLPPLFLAWQDTFGVTFAELGLSLALMSATTAVVQTPVGFLVDRYGARRFLIGGTLLMTLSISGMALATTYWQIVVLAMLSGLGNSVIHPADYAILSGCDEPALKSDSDLPAGTKRTGKIVFDVTVGQTGVIQYENLFGNDAASWKISP